VTILMATRNGAAHLPAQLDSLVAQSHADWVLWVSDDGSTDATRAILARFGQDHPGRLARLVEGPRAGGAAGNFLSLLCHPDLPPGAVALADQDDVWLRGKLARGLRRLDRVPPGRPGLYAAESLLTDVDLRPFGRSREPAARPSFGNALVQNLFGGHSTMLNAPALALVRAAGVPQGIAFHDWWLYQLIAGAGGACLLDPLPVVLYRQHGGNSLGAAGGLRAGFDRAARILGRDYGRWIAAHRAALQAAGDLLTPEARATLAALAAAPRLGPGRLAAFRRHGLRRSTRAADLALALAALTGRV
jgi:glycosyltransferase involved in cell wall biosynthesis